MKLYLAEKIIRDCGGIAKTSVLNAGGIENYEISRLCAGGYIRRIRHGYYSLSEMSDEAILSAVLPEGIVCMQSALYHYGYGSRPDIWNVALPRSVSRSKLSMECISFRPYFIRGELIDLGRTTDSFGNSFLDIYNRERTVCDLFRYRRRITDDAFAEALNAYARDINKDVRRLFEYSEIMNLTDKIKEVMNVLLSEHYSTDIEI